MTAARNNIVKEISRKSIFDDAKALIPSSLTFNQGDLLIYDSTNKVLAAPAAESDGATFLGVSVENVVLGKLKKPYSTSNASVGLNECIAGPVYGVVASLILKSGAVLEAGGLVYLDPANGTQNVQEAGTKAIGVNQGPGITGDGSTRVEILIGSRYPLDTLHL